MSTSTSATEQTTNQYEVSVKQFKEDILTPLAEQFRHIVKLHAAVAVLPAGGHLQFSNGKKVGRKEVNSLDSQFVREIYALAKYFGEAKKRRKSARAGGSNGFKLPRFISSELGKFFADPANDLGPAYVKLEQTGEDGQKTVSYKQLDQPLNDYLALLTKHNITSAALLTPLFNIYAIRNQMQYDPEHREFLRATPLMKKHLGGIFPQLVQKDNEELARKQAELQDLISSGASQKKIEDLRKKIAKSSIFNEDRFPYPRIQSIVAFNMIPKDVLSQEQVDFLKNPEVVSKLEEEQRVVSNTLEFYRTNTAGEKKANRAAKRNQKKK